MSQVILDISANNHKNKKWNIVEMINAIKQIDTGKHEIIFKHQLFLDQPPNLTLSRDVFDFAYHHIKKMGYKSTASVFDLPSLDFLLKYEIPFVKIACRKELYSIIAGNVPLEVPLIISFGCQKDLVGLEKLLPGKRNYLACIPKYPATVVDFMDFTAEQIKLGISDHTEGLSFYNAMQPEIWEKHYKLKGMDGGIESGNWLTTPEELKEIL